MTDVEEIFFSTASKTLKEKEYQVLEANRPLINPKFYRVIKMLLTLKCHPEDKTGFYEQVFNILDINGFDSLNKRNEMLLDFCINLEAIKLAALKEKTFSEYLDCVEIGVSMLIDGFPIEKLDKYTDLTFDELKEIKDNIVSIFI